MDHMNIWKWQEDNRRPTFHEMFMMIAEMVASRSTCDRGPNALFRDHKGTGSIIVSPDKRNVSIGYNGSIAGHSHCDQVGHDMIDGHCSRVIHSEANAILNATFDLRGCCLYTTTKPCYDCAKLILQSRIAEVYYLHDYSSTRGSDVNSLFQKSGVNFYKIDSPFMGNGYYSDRFKQFSSKK